MYKITTKKTNSNSINEYTTIHNSYNFARSNFRFELLFILCDTDNFFRVKWKSEIKEDIILQAAKELLTNLYNIKKPNPEITTVQYKGLPCTYNSNTKKYYYGFSCKDVKQIHIDPNEPTKKPRQYRNDLTKAKDIIRKEFMNWITIEINEDTIIEKLI